MDGSGIKSAVTYELTAVEKNTTPIAELEALEFHLMLELKRVQRVLRKKRVALGRVWPGPREV